MWSVVISFITSLLTKSFSALCTAVAYVFQYFLYVKKEEVKTKKEEKRQEENKKIDEVCDNGSLNDLINLGVK